MKLHLVAVSGNSYKVRILLSLLKVPHELVFVDTRNRAHRQPPFLKLNPRGEVPVIEDDGVVLWDSAAILVYLARKHGGERWLPSAPGPMAEVMQWVALAGSEIRLRHRVCGRCAACRVHPRHGAQCPIEFDDRAIDGVQRLARVHGSHHFRSGPGM